MARSNGRPEPEVIVNYADGFSYVKGKMEEAFRPGGILDKPLSGKPIRDPALASLKRDDVDLIMHEFELTKSQAEKALLQNGGDVRRTIASLVTPPPKPPQ